MKLTDYTDYALRTLIYIAVHPDGLVTIQQIADSFGIPKNHLIKIVHRLGQEGFLLTLRGRSGGIQLARPASQIGVGAVIRTMEPDFGIVECFRTGNECLITPVCGLRGVLHEALQAYFDVLDRHTLEDLVRKPHALQRVLDDRAALVRLPIKTAPA
ncbi:RrF2 family transcriptional regulator [Cupriavidus plantarum]|nr:Rrf2 family transcriptional regulator [Cupriavidus plantarum]NYI00562.1 Rrf2 family nitric oxide-sensitive transcriptional repressor [Cupriavidus plantarum]